MARKDDPVFNVKFVQLVESQPCLWNYTNPGYSKKEEVQKAWQHVANEIKDTVRNSRERWRTIRSSFLRSLKLARTQTGRGKRKYYLSKYLQFLIPYTKSRACHKQTPGQQASTTSAPNGGMVLRKPSTSTTTTTTTTSTTSAAAASYLALSTQPMTRIGHMRLLEHHHQRHHHHHQQQQQQSQQLDQEGDEDTKDSNASRDDDEEQDEDEQQSQLEERQRQAEADAHTPLRLQAIKVENQHQQHQQHQQQQQQQQCADKIAAVLRNNMDWTMAEWLKGSANQLQYHSGNNNNNCDSATNNNNNNTTTQLGHAATPPPAANTPAPAAATVAAGLTLVQPDADYSFLISLHPYLKEMSGKQNRRFRQKVVGLIDNVLDNVDV